MLQIVVFRSMCLTTLLDPLVHSYEVAFSAQTLRKGDKPITSFHAWKLDLVMPKHSRGGCELNLYCD